MKVDLLIIGGGPAGLSAALFFSRLKRPTLVYDSGVYRNAGVQVAHTILGHEGVNPAEHRTKARKEVEDGYPWTSFRDSQVVSLNKAKKGFVARDAQGKEVYARKVILATGIKDHLAAIPGKSSTTSNTSLVRHQSQDPERAHGQACKKHGANASSIASFATAPRLPTSRSLSSSVPVPWPRI